MCRRKTRSLFVGSSSVRMWTSLEADFPDYPVMNRGFGGSHMSDLLYCFDCVVAAYDPALVLVYEGDSDLAGGKSLDEVYDDYLAFVAMVEQQLPHADVAFIATKPSPSRAQYLEVTRQLKEHLEALASTDPLNFWKNITETFSGLADVFPSFKLTGLDPLLTYDFTLYASRMGVRDNRETSYTVVRADFGARGLSACARQFGKIPWLPSRPFSGLEMPMLDNARKQAAAA